MGSSEWTSLTPTTVPSAGARTGWPSPRPAPARGGRWAVPHASHRAACRGEHRIAEAVPGLRPLRIALVAVPLPVEPHEVDGVAHDGSRVVVADERAAPAREHRPL